MKPIKSNRFAFAVASSSLLFSSVLYAQTVEINPAGAIPEAFSLAQAWDWDSVGILDGWTANSNLTLESGSPTIDSGTNGSVKGQAAGIDPNFSSPSTTIATPYRVIIEMRVKKQTSDTTRMDLFWDDALGGFGGGRTFTISAATFAPDDSFKTVRITFPYGRISGQLDKLRFDPISDAAGVGKSFSIDYLRVYTETRPALDWDSNVATAGAQGGSATWDSESSNVWWDGVTNITWPSADTHAANFGGDAGTVTVAPVGVNASILNFSSPGYVVGGGPINLGSDAAVLVTPAATIAPATIATRIESAFVGSAPLTLRSSGSNGAFVLAGDCSEYSGAVALSASSIGIASDNALGVGSVTFGAGGNTFLHALDGDRTISNNVTFAGNRILIDDSGLGSGLTVGNLTIDGNLALNCISPGDLYLRKNLRVNGVVSGSNNSIGILMAGNSGTLTLTNSNTFTGNIRWTVNSVLEVNSDAALGNSANTLSFNAGAGTLRALADFSSTRPININGATSAKIDTNGFDVALGGMITGTTTDPNFTILEKLGAGKLTLSAAGSNLFGGFRVNGGSMEISGGLSYGKWNGSFGVGGGAVCTVVSGGSLSTSYFAVGIGSNPTVDSEFVVDGGSYTNGLELLVAQNGNGRFTMSSGIANLNQLSFGDGADASRLASINLDGGVLAMHRTNRRSGSATAAVNFNGATVRARSSQTDFLRGDSANTSYSIGEGGAIFDSNGFSIEIKAPLQGGSSSGGLTKQGLGTVTLAADNSYTGETSVLQGSLLVQADNSDSAVTVSGSAGLGGNGVIGDATYQDEAKVPLMIVDWLDVPSLDAGSVSIEGALTVVIGENSLANFSDENATIPILRASSLDVADPAALVVDSSGFTSGSGTWSIQKDGNDLNLVYTVGGSGGYGDWASLNADGQGADLDFDGDGVSNGVEYFMGQTGSSFTANPGIVAGKVRWPKNPDFNGTFKVQVSETLALGSWTDIAPPNESIDESNPSEVIFTLPIGAAKKFARLHVTVAP